MTKKNSTLIIIELEQMAFVKSLERKVTKSGEVKNYPSDNSLYTVKINSRISELYQAVNNNYECGNQSANINIKLNYTGSLN